jgi:hypothetical protein
MKSALSIILLLASCRGFGQSIETPCRQELEQKKICVVTKAPLIYPTNECGRNPRGSVDFPVSEHPRHEDDVSKDVKYDSFHGVPKDRSKHPRADEGFGIVQAESSSIA